VPAPTPLGHARQSCPRAVADLLFDVSPRDSLVFAAVGALLLLIALLAAVVPSRQAARVDPVVALRAE
jgi:ABC-type lipoprotein release transport system permease subunit